jgi:hypothetical protein
VTVPLQAWNPVGNLESAISYPDGRVDLVGWVWEPDAGPYATMVHLHVDGRYVGWLTAAQPRPDIGAILPPEAGPGHGFATTIRVAPGWHTVCAYRINIASGTTDPQLGCRVVFI